ncbi:Uma2 family endonuclease [Pueribacillus theae]|uniref:Uma2 family endonuclease n=1 Tax=Pueribacillus theae TaxID=2171751 RepID=UPI001F0B8244|nr:Uma2 family endonuclease [Pueribacillus theae]
MSDKGTNKDKIRESGLTYDDYASIDDGNRYELAGGQLELMSPAPTLTHQMVSSEMYETIVQNCKKDYIILYAPVDVILSETEVRQPDIVLVHRERMQILSNRGIEGAPDLIIEILSPSTLKRDKIDKLKTYADYQVPEYWIVEPETGVLEQYIQIDERLELVNIFHGNEPVSSSNITCISFTMAEIMENIPDLKDRS